MMRIEEARKSLLDSELMDVEAIDARLADWREKSVDGASSGEDFLQWLVQHGALTSFQTDAIKAGHTGPFLVGPYRVLEQLTAYHGDAVYRAIHQEFDQPVSLKILHTSPDDDEETQARVARELRISSIVDHPNVARSFEIGKLGAVYYLAMEDLHGESLADLLTREGRLPFKQACHVIRGVAKGLDYLHQNGVIHRNLRPENIWVGDDFSAKIMGFSSAVDTLAAQFGEVVGAADDDLEASAPIDKYDYMPAEQAYDERCADELSDIYSLGCTLYHCLTSRPPFNLHNPVKKVLHHVFDDPKPASEIAQDVPHQIDETISGMMAKQYEDRFQKAEEVVWALNQYLGSEEEAEKVAVVEINPQYIQWLHHDDPSEQAPISDEAVGATPKLLHFLQFMSERGKS